MAAVEKSIFVFFRHSGKVANDLEKSRPVRKLRKTVQRPGKRFDQFNVFPGIVTKVDELACAIENLQGGEVNHCIFCSAFARPRMEEGKQGDSER